MMRLRLFLVCNVVLIIYKEIININLFYLLFLFLRGHAMRYVHFFIVWGFFLPTTQACEENKVCFAEELFRQKELFMLKQCAHSAKLMGEAEQKKALGEVMENMTKISQDLASVLSAASKTRPVFQGFRDNLSSGPVQISSLVFSHTIRSKIQPDSTKPIG